MKALCLWLIDLTRRCLRTLDWPLWVLLLLLMTIGLMVMHSAGGRHLVIAQGVRFIIGWCALWCLSRVTIPRLRAWTPWIYCTSILPLLTVFAIGTGKYGRQWLNLELFYLQPAELLKISLPLMVAWYLHKMPLPPRMATVLVALLIIAIPAAMVFLQPDFGTGVLITATGLFVLILAGISWWWVFSAAIAVCAVAPVAWFWLLRPYQKDRIMTFLYPDQDALGAGWNIVQSKIAIGSGGLLGKGWGLGTQSHLHFIPEQATDFAFSVHSEEFGWMGVIFVLFLYFCIIARCFWIAVQARDTYSRLLVGAIGFSFFLYVFVNGAMVAGLFPVVGVPMPLISYGGTSAFSMLAGFGLVMATRSHRPVHGH